MSLRDDVEIYRHGDSVVIEFTTPVIPADAPSPFKPTEHRTVAMYFRSRDVGELIAHITRAWNEIETLRAAGELTQTVGHSDGTTTVEKVA